MAEIMKGVIPPTVGHCVIVPLPLPMRSRAIPRIAWRGVIVPGRIGMIVGRGVVPVVVSGPVIGRVRWFFFDAAFLGDSFASRHRFREEYEHFMLHVL